MLCQRCLHPSLFGCSIPFGSRGIVLGNTISARIQTLVIVTHIVGSVPVFGQHMHAQTLMSTTSESLTCPGASKSLLLCMSTRKGTHVFGYRLSWPTRIRLITGHCRVGHLFATKEKSGANAAIVRSGQFPSSSPAPSTRHVIPGQSGHLSRPSGSTPRRWRL